MSRDRASRGLTPLVRLGLTAGIALTLLAGSACVMPPAGRAAAATLSPDGTAGFQTTEKLLINISLARSDEKGRPGTVRLELVDPDGKVVAREAKDVAAEDAGCRFELPALKLLPNRLTLHCSLNGEEFRVPLSRVLVVKAHETSLATGQEFHAGSVAELRCGVHGVKSVSETVPLAGAEVVIALRAKDGKIFALHAGKTGPDGWDKAALKIPAVPAGPYTLQVATRSALGEEKLERNVQVKDAAKVLLVTDKPLYQPGQLMHIRALALRPFDLKPVAGSDLTFEVEDTKGNKVFKRTQRTSDFGIAAVDFQLADEVNMGDYHVRATLGEQQADKTVGVKRYVLPKFKVNVTADKAYYLPKETLHAQVQTDYFFGKPVAGAAVEVTGSTFDVQFRAFQTWKGKTDANGHAKLEISLPAYFVGQPLQKGNALVRLEAKVTDTADHTETVNKSFPVSDQPIAVSLIPEGGRLVPDMENRVYAAATYPDGSPAACAIDVWRGKDAKGKPLASLRTNAAGLAEFYLTPKAEQFRQGPWQQRTLEMVGGQVVPTGSPKLLFDLVAEATDGKGNRARRAAEVTGDLVGENILLRLDKAVYQAGDSLKLEVRSSAGLPTAYLDVVRGGQTLLTRWLDVKDGKADYRLDLPAEAFGTVEVHAYQILASGEIIRDARVVYVQPRADLKVEVKADRDVYRPGQEGKIRFQVTDASGGPTAAALGVIVVDESVYALQEMQPGLEKVYFTLQEELLKPQAQVVYKPAESIDNLVRRRELEASQEQVAQVLLTSVKPKPPARWEVAPALERRRQVEGRVQTIAWSLFSYALTHPDFMQYDKADKRWVFKPGLLDEVVKARYLDPAQLKGPFNDRWSLAELTKLEKEFTVDRLAEAVTWNRMQQLQWAVVNYTRLNQAKWFKDGKWSLPDAVLEDAVKQQRLDARALQDAWGRPIRLVKRDEKLPNQTGWPLFDSYELVSAGADGEFGTDDDVTQFHPQQGARAARYALGAYGNLNVFFAGGFNGRSGMTRTRHLADLGAAPRAFGAGAGFGGGFAGGKGGAMPQAAVPTAGVEKRAGAAPKPGTPLAKGAGEAAPARVREFFPETLLWQPALITDERGVAELPLTFADSITTWRLSASASAVQGALGGVTAPLRVFQDFFVDIDLPVSLTQNDEVAFPVAVYNYLKTPQTVRLDLQAEPWFELTDGGGLTRSLDLQPNEVTSVKFRIRARRIGFQPLTVKAGGSKMSDAVKRTVEVVPDGQKVEQVVTDRLAGSVTQTVTIPDHALADSSRLLVKIYPGVMSQVLEGTEGMLRLPGG